MDWCQLLNPTRRRKTTIPSDPRIQFERDFDRSVFSSPLKRLQDKAQVFPLEPHDAVRTRLTHSLEVSSVARGLAGAAAEWMLCQGEISTGMDQSIVAIAATCGLIHDLGNPPFGHAGEKAISAWFARQKRKGLLLSSLKSEQQIADFMNFEGNAQSLRLVTRLQLLSDYNGLNLTFGTLSALLKYVSSSDEADSTDRDYALRKPGYFASEEDIVKDIRDATGTGNRRNPICFLVEAADDIVYRAVDIEDAVKKGVLSWRRVEEKLTATDSAPVYEALELQKHILNEQQKKGPGPDDDMRAAAFRTAAIRVMSKAVLQVFQVQYGKIMEGGYLGTLLSDSTARKLGDCLQNIAKDEVYTTRSTLTLELMGRHVISDLMDVFWEGAKAMPRSGTPDPSTFAGKAAALISRNYRQVFQHAVAHEQRLPECYHRYQLVTDYVCGMTDSFAKGLHGELFNGS